MIIAAELRKERRRTQGTQETGHCDEAYGKPYPTFTYFCQ